MSNEWRRVAAALSDPERREAYARAVLGQEIATGRRGAKLADDLRDAGLIDSRGRVTEVFAELLAEKPAVTRVGVDRWIRDGRIEQISVGAELPAGGDLGDVFIVEGCTAVYWSDGMATNEIKRTNWNGVERSDAAGAVDATVVFEQQPKGTREELVASLTGFTTGTVYVEYLGGDAVRFVYIGPGQSNIGAPVHIDFDEPYHLNGWFDRRVQEVDLFLDEQLVLAAYFEGDVPLQFGGTRVGAMRGLAPFSGSIERHEVSTSLCERLLAART